MSHPLPILTHLQFFVLRELKVCTLSGQTLRAKLSKSGVRHTKPAFYQLMQRMESEQFVKSEYQMKMRGLQSVTEKLYSITPSGEMCVKESIKFYSKEHP